MIVPSPNGCGTILRMAAANVHVGTSGWGYPSWKPEFYPKEVKTKDFLRYYATKFNAVEVNYTFRRMVSEKAAAGWMQETPPEFHFAIKAHQTITHIRRLKNTEESVKRFVETLRTLDSAGRLGPVLFQLPPNLKCDSGLLRAFLASLPPKLRSTFEFRHESWFNDNIYGVLSDHNAALCIAENEELLTPDVHTADFSYYRFRKPSYGPDELRSIAKRVRERSEKGRVFAFLKHEEDPQSAKWAIEVLDQARGEAA